MNLSTGFTFDAAHQIHRPPIRLTKAEIVRGGHAFDVEFALTWSCYEPTADGRPCGRCDSCLLRREGFAETGLPHPLPYAA